MFGCFYKNELENKMPGMTIENIAAACEGTFVGESVPGYEGNCRSSDRQSPGTKKIICLFRSKGHVWMVMILSRRYLKREHW